MTTTETDFAAILAVIDDGYTDLRPLCVALEAMGDGRAAGMRRLATDENNLHADLWHLPARLDLPGDGDRVACWAPRADAGDRRLEAVPPEVFARLLGGEATTLLPGPEWEHYPYRAYPSPSLAYLALAEALVAV